MPPRKPTPESLRRLSADPGLCRRCVHLRLLDSGRSVFVYCGLSDTDPRFPRYPRLPVLACDGYLPARPEIARYLILNRGALELGVPDGWEVQPKPDDTGTLVVKDPDNLIQLDINCWPAGLPEGLTLEAFLMSVVGNGELELIRGPETGDHGALHYTWVEDVFEMADEDRDGEVRTAHCRWYLCSNDRITGQIRYFYWHDDASWALPTWQAVVDTVQLGSGVPLASPYDHWSMKTPD